MRSREITSSKDPLHKALIEQANFNSAMVRLVMAIVKESKLGGNEEIVTLLNELLDANGYSIGAIGVLVGRQDEGG